MKPVLKWVGGKTQLLDEIKKYIPKDYECYYEPFVGGGAVVFELEPHNAHINDLNKELINVYKQIKKSPIKLIQLLEEHKLNHNKEYFYKIRELDRDKEIYNNLTDLYKASRLIYLNRTCYNGLYRENKKGEFNTPIGSYKNPLICDKTAILELSHYLKEEKVKIKSLDFEKFLATTKENDFVYLDPPYDPLSETSSFTSYSKDGFSKEDQIRLKATCDKLNNKGVKFLLSNSDTAFINDLYKEYKIVKVKARRNINSKGNSRGKINEVMIMNY